jgi:phage tail sheath gpL-like
MSGTSSVISVPGYPAGNLVPGFYAAFDASNANTATINQQTLIVGQRKGGAATVPLFTPTLVASTSSGISACGNPGGMLARMLARYRKGDSYGTVYLGALADDSSATSTTQVATITGTATAAGALSLYISGDLFSVGVSVGDTGTVVATNAAALVNVTPNATASAAAAAGVLTLTSINGGQAAGDMDVRLNYGGTQAGQAIPAGISVSAFTLTAGAVNPSTIVSGTGMTPLQNLFANCGTMNFDFIVFPYTDSASLSALDAFLSQQGGRWSLLQQLYGVGFVAYRGTLGQRTSFSLSRDDQFITGLGYYNSPTSVYEVAADYAAACAVSLRQNPAIPLQTLALTMAAPPAASLDTQSEQQTSLADGLSTTYVDHGGTVRIQRAVTFYTTNADGLPDNSWRDVETPFTLMACVRGLLQQLSSKFQRKILVADGTSISGGSPMVTSQTILAAANAIYTTQCANGLAQNPTLFIQTSQAQNQGNGTVALLLPYMIADQLRIVAIDISFSKP